MRPVTSGLVLVIVVLGGASVPASAGETVVSITFDDSVADQANALPALDGHGMHATFYVISGRLDKPGYLTQAQLHAMEQTGHEVGGHTLQHVDLHLLDADEQKRQICNDRVNLLGMRFQTRSFAYPHGADIPDTPKLVRDCGYNSARDVGGVSCTNCTKAETIPPRDLWAIRTTTSVLVDTPLDTRKGYVMAAEQAGGGWVVLVFHHICDGCNPEGYRAADFAALLDWLAPRQPSGTVVKTIGEVIGGAVKPAVAGPPPSAIRNSENLLSNASLEQDVDTDGVPDCWQLAGHGSSTFEWKRMSDAHDGSFAEQLEVTNVQDGARSLISKQDLGDCAPLVQPGKAYLVAAWYAATVAPRYVAYYRKASGVWQYWTQSPPLPIEANYARHTWRTPAVPADAEAVSVGISISEPGMLKADDFQLTEWNEPGGCGFMAFPFVLIALWSMGLGRSARQGDPKRRSIFIGGLDIEAAAMSERDLARNVQA